MFEVSNTLGSGFVEKVYQRALLCELRLRGMRVAADPLVPVTYSQNAGEYFPIILVEDALIMELKCAEKSSGSESSTDFRPELT